LHCLAAAFHRLFGSSGGMLVDNTDLDILLALDDTNAGLLNSNDF
jgi:hypothetical protein